MARLSVVIAALLATAAPTVAGFGDVVSSFKLPSDLRSADGLTWDGSYLWACHRMGNTFYRVSTAGSIASSFRITNAPYHDYEGAAFDGEYLWCSEHYHRPPPGMVSYKKFTTNGSFVFRFPYYLSPGVSYAGMAYGGGHLWCERFQYTTEGSLVSSFSAPFSLEDLAWDGEYLWSGNKQLTTTGSFVTSFDPPSGIPIGGGTTFDGEYLWLVGGDRWVYQVDIGLGGNPGGHGGGNPGPYDKIKTLYR